MAEIYIDDTAENIFSNCDSISDLAKNVEAKKTESDVLIISVNLKFRNSKRIEKKGIEILKWLRLLKVKNHCILYSFQTLSEIVKGNPLNSILLSKGVTFIHAPFIESELIFEQPEIANRENLFPFFRAEVDLSKIRHELANHYGYAKLLEVHKIVNPLFSSPASIESYNYKLLEYLFVASNKITSISNYTLTDIQTKIGDIKNNSPNVIFLDDKANIGWTDLLQDILGGKIETLQLVDSDDSFTLYDKFKLLQNNKPVDLFICDLRLKETEAALTDYSQLTSYKLVKKIRDNNPKQKILYLTATNDLNKYKAILKLPKYNPQIIFTKEGVDQMYSPAQSVANYTELIDSLHLLLKSEKAISKVHSLQFLNKIQSHDLIKVSNEIDMVFNDLSIIQSTFDDFDFVIFDTNIFYNKDESLKIFKHIHNYPHKTILHKSVYAEIKGLATEEKRKEVNPVAWILANFFLKYFDETKFPISEELMNQTEIDSVNRLDLEKDLADKFLVSLSQEKAQQLQILFVSNDAAEGFRKNKNDSDGPIPILKKWIEETGNKNLRLSDIKTFLKGRNQHHKEVKGIQKQPISQIKYSVVDSFANKTINERLKVKWKDCRFNDKDFTLHFEKDGKSETIRIGKSHIPGFKKAFELLSQTEKEMELVFSKEGFYSVSQITSILENLRTSS